MKLIDQVLAIAKQEGVPVLGMGPCGKMDEGPKGYRPEDLLPHAAGMICFGMPVPRSVYLESRYIPERVCRAQSLYYRRLDTVSLRLAQLLEERGEQAAPVFGCAPMAVNARGEVTGHLNQIRMAVNTGIGYRGRNGLLLHSMYGSRLMLGGLVTTAELPAFRTPEKNERGCPEGCRICIDACPARAISEHRGHVNVMKCLAYSAQTPFMPRWRFAILTRANPKAAAALMNQRAFDEHTTQLCSACVSLCPYGSDAGAGGPAGL